MRRFRLGSALCLFLLSFSISFPKIVLGDSEGVVRLQADGRGGTGFVVALDQEVVFVLTAAHLVVGAEKIVVDFPNDQTRSYPATTLGMEEGTDLALLRVPKPNKAVARLVIASEGTPSGVDGQVLGFPQRALRPRPADVQISGLEGPQLILTGTVASGSSGSPVLYKDSVVGLVVRTRGKYPIAVPAAMLMKALEGWLSEDVFRSISNAKLAPFMCTLNAEKPSCELGETGLSCHVAFFDGPKRAKIDIFGTSSGILSRTLHLRGAVSLGVEALSGAYTLELAHPGDGTFRVIARR